MTGAQLRRLSASVVRLLPGHWPLFVGAGVCVLGLPFAAPSNSWLLAGVVTAMLGLAGVLARVPRSGRAVRAAVLIALVLAGYGWGSLRISTALNERVPLCADGKFRTFEIDIADDPVVIDQPVAVHQSVVVDQSVGAKGTAAPVIARFTAVVRARKDRGCPGLGIHRVRLSWYDPPLLDRGERWRVQGKLRPPWGFLNPAGFDYERWLLGEGLHGTGYVRRGERLSAGDSNPPLLDRLRTALREALRRYPVRHRGLVQGLMLGDDSEITSVQWEGLRKSGTVHLLVVSGLHVGMVAGGLLWLGGWFARLLPPLLRVFGARRMGIAVALTGSGAYVLLSGAGTPAVRAWLMTAVALAALGSGRSVAPCRVLATVFMVVLLLDPLVVHQQGFWLSFGAVAALLAYFQPRSRAGLAGRLPWHAAGDFVKAQLVLLAVMAPLLGFSQGAVPLVSPLANALAVPLVTLWVLPLLLLSAPLLTWLPAAAGFLLSLADRGLDIVLWVIAEAAAVHPVPLALCASWKVVALLGCLWHLRAGHDLGRTAGLLALWIALQLPPGSGLFPGRFRLMVLDVGQGSATLIETRHHRLLFDTGPGFPSGFNLGEAAVIPNYNRRTMVPPDRLILSHADVDHTGGAVAVIDELAPREVLRPATAAGFPGIGCAAGMAWQWDGVSFRILHPSPEPAPGRQSDNDGSCVLLISAGERRVLLPGDISARIERRLEVPPLDVLLSPHHGSRTSSSRPFLDRTHPRHVLVEAPRRSRYGHPHSEVLARYLSAGSRIHITGHHGALVWDSGRPENVIRWRDQHGAYWHRQAPDSEPERQPVAGS